MMPKSGTLPTAPTLEETEAELANIDPRVASILRRRMGLTPVEPEPPKVEPAPETSARAAIREQLADIAATCPPLTPKLCNGLTPGLQRRPRPSRKP